MIIGSVLFFGHKRILVSMVVQDFVQYFTMLRAIPNRFKHRFVSKSQKIVEFTISQAKTIEIHSTERVSVLIAKLRIYQTIDACRRMTSFFFCRENYWFGFKAGDLNG